MLAGQSDCVVTVNESLDVSEAAKAMNQHGIRYIFVVDDRNRPKAVVSMRVLLGSARL